MSQSQQTSQSQSSLTRPEKRPKLDERGNVGMEQSKSTSTEGESPLPDYNLPCHILEEIVLKLSDLKDVLRCLRVCKTWSRILNRVSFWKRYVQSHYDLEAADDPSSDEVLANWQGDRFFIYFVEEGNPEYYVFKPFPVLLKCGIIVGSGFKLPDGDTGQHFATLTIAVDKLLTLKKKSAKFECNVMAYGNEGDGPHAIWLMPWNDSGMPSGKEVLSYFNVNPKIAETLTSSSRETLSKGHQTGSFTTTFDVENEDYDDEDDEDDDDNDDDGDDGGCGNVEQQLADDDANEEETGGDEENEEQDEGDREEENVEEEEEDNEDEQENIDGEEEGAGDEEREENEDGEEEEEKEDDERDEQEEEQKDKPTEDKKNLAQARKENEAFKHWLRLLFRPSHVLSAGENVFNPTLYLHMTRLSQDYVGGIMSTVVMT